MAVGVVDPGEQPAIHRQRLTAERLRLAVVALRYVQTRQVVNALGDVRVAVGALTQGPATGRFIYIDIGRLAGQKDCEWERRLKVPLSGISWDMIQHVVADPKLVLEAHLPGTAKDGGPSCATVHPVQAWKFRRSK